MKKILALALAMLLVLAVFAGCAAKQTADTPADAPKSDPAADAASDTEQPAASGEKKTVKIFQYKVEIADQLLALADEYMQLHPEINLVVESVDSTDYNTLLKTKFASGEALSLIHI